MRIRNLGNVFWGVILLVLAALIVLNQMGVFFITFRIWDIVLAVIALKLFISTFVHGKASTLPIAAALIYIVLRNQGLVPDVPIGTIAAVTALSSIGLSFLFPGRRRWRKYRYGHIGAFSGSSGTWDENKSESCDEISTDNNPTIRISFGSASRYLYADALESANLSCNFGGMEIYFDQVQLHQNGATVYVDCKFGGIDLFVPRHWNVVEQVESSFGGTDVSRRLEPLQEGAPTLTIVGDVAFGGIDIHYV